MKRYKVKGTEDASECLGCGRQDLKSRVVLAVLDLEGNETGEYLRLGRVCAAKTMRGTVKQVDQGVNKARKEAFEAKMKADREFEVKVWATDEVKQAVADHQAGKITVIERVRVIMAVQRRLASE